MKYLFIAGSLLIAGLLFIFILNSKNFIEVNRISKPVYTPSPSAAPSLLEDLLPLFRLSLASWNRGERVDSKPDYSIYVDFGSGRDLSGVVWTAETQGLAKNKAFEIEKEFELYYSSEFEKRSWSDNIIIKGHRISVISAGGANGKIWGFIANENDNLRVIILSEDYNEENSNMILTVFVSDIVPIKTLI